MLSCEETAMVFWDHQGICRVFDSPDELFVETEMSEITWHLCSKLSGDSLEVMDECVVCGWKNGAFIAGAMSSSSSWFAIVVEDQVGQDKTCTSDVTVCYVSVEQASYVLT